MWVNGVDMLQEMVAVFCILDDKGVIQIPKPQPRWVGGLVEGLDVELFHEQVCYNGANGRSHGFL